jgi:hypothetical protein
MFVDQLEEYVWRIYQPQHSQNSTHTQPLNGHVGSFGHQARLLLHFQKH